MKKKILLQIHTIGYYYYGVAAIKTLYENQDFDLDIVLFPQSELAKETALNVLENVENIENIYIFDFGFTNKLFNIAKVKGKNFFSRMKFKFFSKHKIVRNIKTRLNDNEYDAVFYCHDSRNRIMSFLKFAYPNSEFVMYGDGFGFFFTNRSNFLSNQDYEEHVMFKDIMPDRAVALIPCIMDNFFDNACIPLTVTKREFMIEALTSNENFQQKIENYVEKINHDYPNISKGIFMTSNWTEVGWTTFEQEVEINTEVIKKYFSKDSLIIIKPHPIQFKSMLNAYKKLLNDEYKIIEIDDSIKLSSIEMMPKLLEDCQTFVSYSSSSAIIKYLYNIDDVCVISVLEKYNLTSCVKEITRFKEIISALEKWDKKSFVYKC